MPKCAYCNSIIPWGEGLFEEGKWYEEKCYKQKTIKRRSEIERKATTGEITLTEAQELKDILQLLENLKNPLPTKLPLNYTQKHKIDYPINRVRFGKRVDLEDMLKSGEVRKSSELNPENGKPMYALTEPTKPIMNAVYCESPKNIIPYTELKRLEKEQAQQKQIEGDIIGTM